MTADLCGAETGTEVRTVLTTDDIASAPREKRTDRRGVAGNFFVFKIGGAACDRMWSLDACERALRKANDHAFTVGVALGPCSLPQTLRPNFEIGPDEIEVGMGIHGESGIGRETLKPADAIVDDIVDRLLSEMAPGRRDRVAVLVNSLGATSYIQLFVTNRRLAAARLKDAGLETHATWVGPYCTSLDMAGASNTLLRLDGELTELLDHPCDAAMFWSRPDRPVTAPAKSEPPAKPVTRPGESEFAPAGPSSPARRNGGGGAAIAWMIANIADAVSAAREHLCEPDGHVGDADHGIAMSAGFEAARTATAAAAPDTSPAEAFAIASKAFLNAVGASSGPLYAAAMLKAGNALREVEAISDDDVLSIVEAFAAGIRR